MELKYCKVGVLISDSDLRKRLSDLLWQNGAVVYSTGDDDEMERWIQIFGIGVVVVDVEPKSSQFCLN